VDAQRLLEAVRAALAADAALISAGERAAIDRQVAALAAVAATNDHRAIKQAGEALNRATEEFAGRRMDAGVRRALAGKSIASLDL
jgi:molecular chaperone HscA